MQNFVNIDTHGVHTCRYNSFVKVHGTETLIYANGNKVCLRYLSPNSEVFEFKIMEDIIMVIKQTTIFSEDRQYEPVFAAISYDCHLVIFKVENLQIKVL